MSRICEKEKVAKLNMRVPQYQIPTLLHPSLSRNVEVHCKRKLLAVFLPVNLVLQLLVDQQDQVFRLNRYHPSGGKQEVMFVSGQNVVF